MAQSSFKETNRQIRGHCKRVRKTLVEYLDHQLSPEERRTVDQHLKVCPNCSAERAALKQTLGLLRQRELPDPGDDFWTTLRYRVRQGIREKRDVSFVQPPVPARAWVPAVVVASLFVFLFLWWSNRPQLPVPGQQPLLVHLEREGLRNLQMLQESGLVIEDPGIAKTPGDSLVELLMAINHPAETLEMVLVRERVAESPDLWEMVVEEELTPEPSLEVLLEDLTEAQLMELSSRLEKIIG